MKNRDICYYFSASYTAHLHHNKSLLLFDTIQICLLIYYSSESADGILNRHPLLSVERIWKVDSLQNKLLIVDDEALILKSLKRLFRRSSFDVLTANTASDALEIIRTQPISVLLSDFSMPDMTGASLLSLAKDIQPEMSRIILSGNNDQDAVIQSLNQGAAHRFLTKPWNDDFLVQEIEQAFERFKSTQFVTENSNLLTRKALSGKLKQSLNSATGELLVLAFTTNDSAALINSEVTDLLHTQVCASIASVPWLSESGYALGMLDEKRFCLSLPSIEEPRRTVDELMSVLPSFLQAGDLSVPLKFYSGYTVTKHGDSPASIFRHITTALLEAVDSSSTSPKQYKQIQSDFRQRQATIESRLFAAIENDELYINYQPKIRTLDQSLCGAEALIRWSNPTLGQVPPFDFIPIAESNGLIHPIGMWVMEQSIEQWNKWFSSDNLTTRISINVSSIQLEDKNLIQAVQQLIDRFSINPKCLELELTETCLMKDSASSLDRLNELKELGLHLSVDDFGTGYSSLSYLSQLPIDTIKIDRSFITAMMDHQQSESLVKNIIAIAKDLHKETVAEGVETKSQLNKLTSLGCDVIQGYYFNKPLSPIDFQAHYKDSISQKNSGIASYPNLDKKTA